MKTASKTTQYTPHYQEQCFQAWYLAGRPSSARQIQESLPDDEYGRKPSLITLALWRDELGWDIRADDLDVKANAVVENDLINSRVLMLKEQASRARELQTMGLNYLREDGFDSSSSAVAAIIKGADLERVSKGLSESITKMLQMDDTQLTSEVQKLLDRASVPADVIDMDDEPVSEQILENVEDGDSDNEDDDVEDA